MIRILDPSLEAATWKTGLKGGFGFTASGSFEKNQGVKTLGLPTPWFYAFIAKISNLL